MKVPYQLRWQPTNVPATALLVPGHSVRDLLRVCAELSLDPLPTIFTVADGFVIHLPSPSERLIVGVVRLHRMSAHLLLPIDAQLVPSLLPDEASALVRNRGLVFLPGPRVLEYDPACPVAPAALFRMDVVRCRPWRSLPDAPLLADDVAEITLLDFGTSPEQVLEPGGAGIGTQDAPLADGNLPARLLANTLFNLGKGLAQLGQSLDSKALAGLGAKMLGGAMSLVPNLSEKLMGQQAARLRELLRQFREGNIDQALERALPLGGEPGRGMTPAQSADLPTNSLFYSLARLLEGGGGSGGAMWFTPDQTYYELLAEYRKQAELAARRGDFRRAAYIYAKLLNEFHSAARVLAQGGLHRDAAILYEKKLQDLASAAREWQAAGEFDRAIHLYRKMGDHATAGDLLRRIGEEDRAVQEYQLAAAKLLESGPKYHEAGELMLGRARRPDLALEYYETGWTRRPEGNALACATRLVQHHASEGTADRFLTIVDEADQFLAERDVESTANFFTEIARLAAVPGLAAIADEARDRALMGIATKMRKNAATSPRSAGSLARMLKDPAVWPVPLVGDAQYALTQLGRADRPAAPAAYPTVRAGRSTVTAVAQAPQSNQVFLGFENGEVCCFDSGNGSVHVLTRENGPILSLMIDASKTYVVILSQLTADRVCLRVISREVGYRMIDYYWLNVTGEARLAVSPVNSAVQFAVLYFGKEYRVFSLPNLVGVGSGSFEERDEDPPVVLFGSSNGQPSSLWLMTLNHGGASGGYASPRMARVDVGDPRLWTPGSNQASTLRQVWLHAVE